MDDISHHKLLQNLEIDPATLPKIEEVEFLKLESDYLWMRLTGRGLFLLFLLGIGTVLLFTTDLEAWMIFPPLAILFTLIFILEVIGFKIKGYALRERDVSYKTGLIWFSMTTVPFNRIQHCEVNQGPLARLFDLASVKVYTAGGSSSDLSINGLQKEKAEELRDFITKRAAEYE